MRRIVVVCLVLLGAAAAPAAASTVAVPGSDGSARDFVVYRAAPGEANRLTFGFDQERRAVTVTDPGATIATGRGCTAVDAHTAVCTNPDVLQPIDGGGPELLELGSAQLGDGDDSATVDTPPQTAPGVVLDGGPGDDELTGGPFSDRLVGGGGADRLSGGDGDDKLADGDTDATADADTIDGGEGVDRVDYAGRTADLEVDLDRGRGGTAAERDTLTGVENVEAGAGDDELFGDDGDNVLRGHDGDDVLRARDAGRGYGERLDGGPGRDRLVGGSGSGLLTPGAGLDRVACGGGTDTVDGPRPGEDLGRSCERVSFVFNGDGDRFTLATYPRRSGSRLTWRTGCPGQEGFDGETAGCDGTFLLRAGAAPGGALLARGTLQGTDFEERSQTRVVLAPVAGIPGSGRVTVRTRGDNLPEAGWTIGL